MGHRQDQGRVVEETIGLLYEAAAAPELWGGALDKLHELFDAKAAHLFVWDKSSDRPVSSYASSTYEGREESLDYYLNIDPRRRWLNRQPVGSILLCHEHFDDVFVRRDEFFQDYSLPLGRRYLIGTNLLQADSSLSVLAVLRSPSQGPFDPANRLLLEHIRPHLQRIARMHHRFEQMRDESNVARDLLDSVQTCLIATDATARIIRANRGAETILRGRSGLRVMGGKLVAQTLSQTATLHRLIRKAVATEGDTAVGGGMMLECETGERQGIMVVPLSPRSSILDKLEIPLALVMVSSLKEGQAEPSRSFVDMLGLTQAEARLAAEIASGKRLDVVAEERGVRMTTLRTQLHSIYAKTGTSRQAELVHLLSSLPRIRLDR